MLTLNDGRYELWQWDTGRTLAVDADCSQVHFSNKVFGRSIDVDVDDGVATIPDILLQTDKDLNVWAFVGTAENGYTKISKTFKVNRRNKPADYVFTPVEQTTIAEIAAIAQSVRDDADAGLFDGKPGENGTDGYSPSANVTQNDNGATITITDKNGTTTATVTNGKDGQDGSPGKDGVDGQPGADGNNGQDGSDGVGIQSVVQTTTSTEDGGTNVVTVTKTDGTSSTFAVRNGNRGSVGPAGANGKDGAPGADGKTPVYGVDYGTPEQIAGIAQQAAVLLKPELNQIKDDIAAITPDDTTVDGKPWTSKKILDSLCQPFEESGNPVQCYPVENYPLGVRVSWEPVQEGSGGPSPDNIRPIKGRDSVKVERCGENLLNIKPFNKFTKNGITFEYVPDGGIHISGTATANVDGPVYPVWHLPPGKYYGMNKVKGIPASFVVQRNGKLLWLNSKGIFEILAGDVTKYWYVFVNAGTTVDDTIYPYIVPGTTAPTTYEPYTGSTTGIALPETVYGGEVDAWSGEVAETWGLVTLDGTEQWNVSGKFLDNKTDWYYVSSRIPNAVNAGPQEGNEICSHYPHADIANTNTVQGCAIVWGAIRVRWGDTIPDDVNSWKAYLAAQYAAGTPVQIAYKLAEPVPFTATGAQPIHALSGVNTVLTDADGVVVTGAEDPRHTITELKNAIISIGGNV